MRIPKTNLNKTIDAGRETSKEKGRFRERSRTPGANNLNNTIDVAGGDYNRQDGSTRNNLNNVTL